MGLRRIIAEAAARAPVPVFVVAAEGGREAAQDLRLHDDVHLMASPGPANVLIVAGRMEAERVEAIARLHDGMSHPRGTIWWTLGRAPDLLPTALPGTVVVDGDVVAAAVRLNRELLTGQVASEPPTLPDVEPAPWRGMGPYGQGGTGMTGGVPYGRPMAELAPDRDGLRLDVLPLRIGPFLPGLPTGLLLDIGWAGDVVVAASVGSGVSWTGASRPPRDVRPLLRPFIRALTEPVSVAELEMARARDHLRWLADALVIHGLPALAGRVLRLVATLSPAHAGKVRDLAEVISRSQILRWSAGGVGRVDPRRLSGLAVGPVARSAGLREDSRLEDPSYRGLGFEPLATDRVDAAGRWRYRWAEAVQSLELSGRAGDIRTEPSGRVESPRGLLERGSAPSARLLALLPSLLEGSSWGDAVTTIVSLDLDLEEIAAVGDGTTATDAEASAETGDVSAPPRAA